LLVLEPLMDFLKTNDLQAPSSLDAAPLGEGHSNVTFALSTGLVLRRPPRGPLPPSAHDVLREARLLRALEQTPVRAPKVLAVCEDPAAIGAPFYIMEHVEGVVVTDALPEPLDNPAQRGRIADELIEALVELHAVDWSEVGLEGFGKPTGYLDRQLRRFSGLWEHNRTRELEILDRVTAWLGEHKPESGEATIVHGDYRLGNTMFAPGTPARLVAIFDWELATIGDPLADVGYMLATWAQEGDEENAISALGGVTRRPGFASREELVARYEEASGRSMQAVNWYMALALWKSAVFLEGSYKRRLAGTTDDPFFDLLEKGVPEIAERAWQVAQG
jgi:aminoglycoside phosphotransferase (APT) family kinase protein